MSALRSRSDGITLEWLDPGDAGYRPPFHVAAARVRLPGGEQMACFGRARDAAQAAERARAEASERVACATPGRLYEARMDELRSPIDPRTIVAFSEAQYRRPGFPFKRFSECRRYSWTEGRDLATGARRDVLAELVWFRRFLPARVRSQAYWRTSTSGVAAHPAWDRAVEHAALELIERDAFMRAWLGYDAGTTLRSMPAALTARVRRLRAAGIRITCKLLKTDPAFVFLVFAQDRARGFTRVTAAAGVDAEQTLDHALMEAEAQVAAVLAMPPPRGMRPAEVRFPVDHGLLYAQRRYFRRADFLAEGGRRIDMPGASRHRPGLDALVGRMRRAGLRPVWVSLAPEASLHVVRVLVPGLVPMTFGNGTEPLGLVCPSAGWKPFPHPFS
jgi:thiazole/oxazole-forming peptide maturase SagD family component